ncbi:MAG TPA: VOC family protein [Actinomycetota bacterium]
MATIKEAIGMLPVRDLEAAKSWWADRFSLKPTEDSDMGSYYEVGSTRFLVYPSQFAGSNQATAMGLHVDDVESTVEELRSKGVQFEEYDMPQIKTERGIATMEEGGRTMQVAWFKDPDGNIISISNY